MVGELPGSFESVDSRRLGHDGLTMVQRCRGLWAVHLAGNLVAIAVLRRVASWFQECVFNDCDLPKPDPDAWVAAADRETPAQAELRAP
jgi:hypothetical protein